MHSIPSPLPLVPPLDRQEIALFLDMDGTLVEFAPTPDAVSPPKGAGGRLNLLSSRLDGALALVSGRSLKELDQILAPGQFAAAGSHGLEYRASPGGRVESPAPVPNDIHSWRTLLTPLLTAHPDLLLEVKLAGVAIHYRSAPSLRAQVIEAAQHALLQGPSGYHLLPGNMVVEIKPANRGKGDAVARFMTHPPFSSRKPVFVGDDVTDEDGFRAAQSLGGLGILVGDRRPTDAQAGLPDVASVWAWLDLLACTTTAP